MPSRWSKTRIVPKMESGNDFAIFQCEKCTFATYFVRSFKGHLTKKHGGAKLFCCQKCEYVAPIKKYVEAHAKIAHIEVKRKPVNENPKIKMENRIKKEKENINQKSMIKIRNRIKKEKKNINQKSKKKIEKPIKTEKKKCRQQCNQCTYSTNISHFLLEHIKAVHFKEKGFSCKICPFVTGWRSSLSQHMKKIHVSKNEPLGGGWLNSTEIHGLNIDENVQNTKNEASNFNNGYNDETVMFDKPSADVKIIPLLHSSKMNSNLKKDMINKIIQAENSSEGIISGTSIKEKYIQTISSENNAPIAQYNLMDENRYLKNEIKQLKKELSDISKERDVHKKEKDKLAKELKDERQNTEKLSMLLKEKETLLSNKERKIDLIKNQINDTLNGIKVDSPL